jgi:hypothetical protein
MPDFHDDLEAAQARVLQGVRLRLGRRWEAYSDQDRELIGRCARRATMAALREQMTGRRDEDEWRAIVAQGRNIEVAIAMDAEGLLTRTILDAVSEVLTIGAKLLGGFLGTLVPGRNP